MNVEKKISALTIQQLALIALVLAVIVVSWQNWAAIETRLKPNK